VPDPVTTRSTRPGRHTMPFRANLSAGRPRDRGCANPALTIPACPVPSTGRTNWSSRASRPDRIGRHNTGDERDRGAWHLPGTCRAQGRRAFLSLQKLSYDNSGKILLVLGCWHSLRSRAGSVRRRRPAARAIRRSRHDSCHHHHHRGVHRLPGTAQARATVGTLSTSQQLARTAVGPQPRPPFHDGLGRAT
jgi:hypothetical protein